MKHRITLETAIIVIKYAIRPMNCWPLPIGSSNLVILKHNLCFWISLVNLAFSIGGYTYTIYGNRHDTYRIVKLTSEMIAVIAAMGKLVVCRIEASRMQFLISTMTTFLKQASPNEREVIQGYVDRCLMIHTIALGCAIVAPLAFIAGPLMTSQSFPGEFEYPFSTESYWIWAALYISQSICLIHAGTVVFADVLCAILLWYTGARFHMLCLEFQKATSADEVIRCIQKHQELIGYADRLKITTRIVAVEVTTIVMFAVTVQGFVLIGDPPLYDLTKYVFYTLATALRLFLVAWPADNLIDVSERVGDAAYDCDWIGKPPEMLKNLMIVIQRCKNPMTISVDGLLPALSLEFYGSTMAATFSYLTTLRAIAVD